MAKYTGPVCRMCRREGVKLFLKGTRCYTPKCAFERRDTPPGQHGRVRGKQSEYGAQLREKQKLRRIYGILERQFALMYQRAMRIKGITGDTLLAMLETRLDNIVYRAGFATSHAMARQMVNHGLVTLNGKKASIPSMPVKPGAVVGCRDKDNARNKIKAALAEFSDAYVPPEWLQVDKEQIKATLLRMPERADIKVPVNESLVVELYSK